MRPSEIREQILEERRRIRPLLDQAERCAERALVGQASERELLARTAALEEAYRDLVDDEKALLIPELREADAWGEVRASELISTHRDQRARLATTRDAAEEGVVAPRQLARRVILTVQAIRSELDRQERRYLSPDLLRDDLVVISQTGG